MSVVSKSYFRELLECMKKYVKVTTGLLIKNFELDSVALFMLSAYRDILVHTVKSFGVVSSKLFD